MLSSSGTLPTQLALRSVQLDNGLTVLVQEVHTAPLVSVWAWCGVGSRDEGVGLTGASHWVEHMNFKGTVNIPREDMKGIVERFGGMWNGYTWIDQTTYLETASRDALDRMLFIEAERMNDSLFDRDECESERTVIISELQGATTIPSRCSIRAHCHGLSRAYLPSSDHWLAARPAGDDARRPLCALSALLCSL